MSRKEFTCLEPEEIQKRETTQTSNVLFLVFVGIILCYNKLLVKKRMKTLKFAQVLQNQLIYLKTEVKGPVFRLYK